MFGDFDLHWKGLLKLVEMRDDQHLFEILANFLDGFDELFQSLLVLGAKALVDKERVQAGARAHGQHLGERDAQGEIGAECLAPGIEVIGALANLVGDLDVEGFAGAAFFEVAQRFKGDLDAVVG